MTDVYTRVSAGGVVAGRDVFAFEGGDLVDDDLQELITVSLFTWRRARDSDPIPDGGSRQGWFGDPSFGSRLYLLSEQNLTTEALSSAKQYVEEALAWLVTDGVLVAVSSTAEATAQGWLTLTIEFARPLQPEKRERYSYLWST